MRCEQFLKSIAVGPSPGPLAAIPGQDRSRHPALEMQRIHEDKLTLCAALETIADTLPDAVCRLECLRIASILVPMLRDAHNYEGDVIFPAFASATGRSDTDPTLHRLRVEHVEDESFADEVTEVLLAVGHGKPIENPEAFGFMLRGLFETLRRHIAFEREHVLPVIVGD